MSASFCGCVNQWEQVLGLQVLEDTKHLSLPTGRVVPDSTWIDYLDTNKDADSAW